MSDTVWCELNNRSNLFKLHDKCPNNKCSCQKLTTFTPRQSQMEGAGYKNTMKEILEETEKVWKNIIKPGLKQLVLIF